MTAPNRCPLCRTNNPTGHHHCAERTARRVALDAKIAAGMTTPEGAR